MTIFLSSFPLKDAFRAGQHFAKHYPQSLVHINRLSLEQHKLNNGRASCNSTAQKSSNIDRQTVETSLSNYGAADSNSNVTATYDCKVHGSASVMRSTVDVTTESKIGTANLMTSALKCSDLINKSETFESSSVNCLSLNTNSKSVPDQASEVTKTKSSLLAKQKHSDTHLSSQFSESESSFLGFRNRDLDDKNSLNGASVERVGKLKGK